MKKNISKALTALLFAFLAVSCSDFFDVDQKELIGPDLVNNNEEYITGLWSVMYWCLDNGFREVGETMLASSCDEAQSNVRGSAATAFNQGSWNSYSNPYGRNWEYLYQQIENANHFLAVSDTTKNRDFNFFHDYKSTPDNMYRYNTFLFNLKAWRMDARFFKAYLHFQLWRQYGRIAIVDRELSQKEAQALKQATTAEVVDYISDLLDGVIAEFDQLEQMPNAYYGGGRWTSSDLGRITKGAALALKCRMLLYAASPLNNGGSYDAELCDRAARTAAEIINMGIYNEYISYENLQFDRSAANPENILDNRADIPDSNYMEVWNYPHSGLAEFTNVDGLGSNVTSPSQNLVDAYAKLPGYTDAFPFGARDDRFYSTIIYDGRTFNGATVESYAGGADGINERYSTATGYYLKKFVAEGVTLPVGTLASRLWYIFRYSEVLLNYSEAMYNAHGNAYKGYINGTDLNALDALNKVRLRGGLNPNNVAATSIDNDVIRNERQVELAFEGHRFWDVRRWMIAAQTENQPLRGMYITLNSDGTKSYDPHYVVGSRTFRAGMEHFPIPYDEMHRYPQWTQNWW